MKTLVALLVLLLVGCGEKIREAPEVGEVYQLPPMEWRVVTRAELNQVLTASGVHLKETDKLEGFTGIDGRGTRVIYTLAPARVDDSPTLTLGHEILHVALGDYHQ